MYALLSNPIFLVVIGTIGFVWYSTDNNHKKHILLGKFKHIFARPKKNKYLCHPYQTK